VFASGGFCGSRRAFRCDRGVKRQCTIFHALVGVFTEKTHRDTLRRACVFASGGICGSRSGFRCVRVAKRRYSIFHARVGLVRILQKCVRTRYAELVFLHPVGSTGHVVHYVASGERNVDELFFMLGSD
jgi:hypothetical protein